MNVKYSLETLNKKEKTSVNNIAIGADHRGYRYKASLINRFAIEGHTINWIDVGTYNETRTDYPEYAKAVCEKIEEGEAQCGILLCGTGIGMAVVANRYTGIYAGVVWNEQVARLSKEDDNVNVLVIPADFVTEDEMFDMIYAWLTASFLEGRYQKRLSMIDE
jgi:ribose 5-phosphate isomerase B